MQIDRRALIGACAATVVAPRRAFAAARTLERRFPESFLWGAATSGHQTEGNNVSSDAWVVENVKPTTYSEPSGDAVNSFNLWPEDLDIVRSLGLNAYRFSIEWSRIEPEPGLFSIAMLDHYKAVIEGCRKRGIAPVVSFNHNTTPRWFAARGGWGDPSAPDLFAVFCDRAARHLAGDMAYATTLNEPNLGNLVLQAPAALIARLLPIARAAEQAAARAVGSARFGAPASATRSDIEILTRRLVAAHKAGRAAIKAVRPDLPVGVTLAVIDDEPATSDSMYNEVRADTCGAWLEAAQGDDFVGVQNYARRLWNATGKVEPPVGGVRNAAGEEVYPPSLANAVRYAYSVARVPILVTEHGVNTQDDRIRARLIPEALEHLQAAMQEGVPVKGYLHWSLLDNFEWGDGFKSRFGLVAVDRTTFKRTPKPSAAILARIARRNSLPAT